MKLIFAILLFSAALPAFAQTNPSATKTQRPRAQTPVKKLPPKTVEVAPPAPVVEEPVVVQAPDEAPEVASTNRLGKSFSLGVIGGLVGLAVPFKYGVSAAWVMNESWTFEASYFSGNFSVDYAWLDLGSFTDSVYSIQSRYYPGKSFNWILGIARQDYHVALGSDIVSAFTGEASDYDALTVHIVDLQIGFGNRWQWNNGFMLGVDWLILNIPIATLKNEAPPLDAINNASIRNQIEDGLRFMRYLPTGALAKVTLGFTF